MSDDKLSGRCHCNRRVRVLWSGPIGKTSRPVLLVCGWYPELRCDFRQDIPASKVSGRPE